MITIPFLGQWGNQLFQYCMGRILAQRTGQEYWCPLEWRKKNGDPVGYANGPIVPHPTPVAGRAVMDAVDYGFRPHWFDADKVDLSRGISVAGYFQRYEILKPYKDQIRNDWLKLQQSFVKTYPDAVYIHVRRTDYVGDDLNPEHQCTATTIDEYAECLKEFPQARRIIIVSDNYNDPFLHAFRALGKTAELSLGTWDEDFMRLASCRWMIMSQSTYSWWAGFLGRAEKIVCPVSPKSLWGRGRDMMGAPRGRDYPNLFPFDEGERWKWVTT